MNHQIKDFEVVIITTVNYHQTLIPDYDYFFMRLSCGAPSPDSLL